MSSSPPATPETALARAVALAESRPATLGTGRLICIDGPSGAGKTTLASGLAAMRSGTPVVHMDDLYEGWRGLSSVADQLESLLRPLSRGRSGSYRRWDWGAGAWAETHTVEPTPLLVLEGVGSGCSGTVALATVIVWVDADRDTRLARGIARDGEAYAPYWQQWAEDEAAHFAVHRTQTRADFRIDTSALEEPS